jgi:Carboxypeptidase regulatory-like domain
MFHKKTLGITIAALALTAACGGGGEKSEAPAEQTAATMEYVTVDPATAATVTGKVSFEGQPPKAQPINMSAEPDCKKLHGEAVYPDVVAIDAAGGLANVFVWVKSGLEGKNFKPSDQPVELDQKGCIYQPHVLALQVNQPLEVVNTDPLTHNVHPLPTVNREWNKSQTPGSPAIDYKFPRQEIMLPVKCNIHPWMRSYISVVDHPFFAVTKADGTFEIKGLPPGTYTIEAKHESLGEKEMSVTLTDAGSATADFAFVAK